MNKSVQPMPKWKKINRKRTIRNFIIVGLLVQIFAVGLFWIGCAAYFEEQDLIHNGTEVTAIFDEISEISSFYSDGGSIPTEKIHGYELRYTYVDYNGRKYQNYGRYYKNKAEAESHIGESVQILINDKGKCRIVGDAILEWTPWFTLALVFSSVMFLYILAMIIFRKKIFIQKDEKAYLTVK